MRLQVLTKAEQPPCPPKPRKLLSHFLPSEGPILCYITLMANDQVSAACAFASPGTVSPRRGQTKAQVPAQATMSADNRSREQVCAVCVLLVQPVFALATDDKEHQCPQGPPFSTNGY